MGRASPAGAPRLPVAVLFGGLLGGLVAGPAFPTAQFPSPQMAGGFTAARVVEGLVEPTDLVVAPDGALWIAEQAGQVRRIALDPSGGSAVPDHVVLDIRVEVLQFRDLGLAALALHPGFLADGGENSWIYLYYVVDPTPPLDLPNGGDGMYSFGRLARWRVETLEGLPTAIAGSRHVLLGEQLPSGSAPTALAALHESHQGGGLAFGHDGSLLLATGDGANYFAPDVGGMQPFGFDDLVNPTTGQVGALPKAQDGGAFRAQSLASLSGKLLRVDPQTGRGYPSNPFYDGDPASLASRVWALGLRNPFRIAVVPTDDEGPGLVVVADVGWLDWEELNAVRRGDNLGWPCAEGPDTREPFFSHDFGANPLGLTACADALLPWIEPAAAWRRDDASAQLPSGSHVDANGAPLGGFAGFCAIGGGVLAGPAIPAAYAGRYLFADYGSTWIKAARLDSFGAVESILDIGKLFAGPIAIAVDTTTGAAYVLLRGYGVGPAEVVRINPPNLEPALAWTSVPGAGLAADVLVLESNTPATLGSTVAFNVSGATSGSALVLAATLGGAYVELLHVTVLIDPAQTALLLTAVALGGGSGTFNLLIPNIPSLVGVPLHCQAFAFDIAVEGGLAASQGLFALFSAP